MRGHLHALNASLAILSKYYSKYQAKINKQANDAWRLPGQMWTPAEPGSRQTFPAWVGAWGFGLTVAWLFPLPWDVKQIRSADLQTSSSICVTDSTLACIAIPVQIWIFSCLICLCCYFVEANNIFFLHRVHQIMIPSSRCFFQSFTVILGSPLHDL